MSMKKIISLIVSLTLLTTITSAQNLPGFKSDVSVGYFSKFIEFGEVAYKDAYVAGVDVSWQSFKVSVLTVNDLNLSPFTSKLNRLDVGASYKFFSTFVDLEVGNKWQFNNNANVEDHDNHIRPFVKLSKGSLMVVGKFDVQSRISNLEASFKTTKLKVLGLEFQPAVLAGYTDVQDLLPKSATKIQWNKSYFGGSLDASWKWFSTGGYLVTNKKFSDTVTGWKVAGNYTF